MAKISKKNLPDAPPVEAFEPEPPKLQAEPVPIPSDDAQDPELAEEPSADEESPDETQTAAEPANRGGRWPRRFGDADHTILDRLMALESWEGIWAYVYRIQPMTNRLVGGNRKVHVRRWDTPFDAQALMEEAGSGVYQIQVTRLDPKTGKRPMFDSGEIRIVNQNHPPLIPIGEWLDDPKNKEWWWAKEAILKKEALRHPPPAAAPPPPDPLVEVLRDQITAQRSEMAELRKEIRESATKKDPTEQTLISIIVPFIPAIVAKMTATPPPPPPNPVEALAMRLLEKQMEAKTDAAPKDPQAELERQFELQRKMEEHFGSSRNGSARSRKSGTQEFITDLVREASPVFAPLMQVIAAGILQKQREAAAAQGQQPAQQAQPGQQPPPMLVQVAAPAETAQPGASPATGPQLVKKPTLEAIAAAVLDHLQTGKVGLDLGDWYIEEFGKQEFNELRLQGKRKLMEDLYSVPAFTAASVEQGEVDMLLTEFLTWEPDDEDDDDDDDEAAATQQPAINTGWTAPAV